jgi:hypothetical protein
VFDIRRSDETSHPELTAVGSVLLENIEAGYPIDVDNEFGGREAQFHEWNQALTPGKHLGTIAVLGKK